MWVNESVVRVSLTNCSNLGTDLMTRKTQRSVIQPTAKKGFVKTRFVKFFG